MHRNVLIHRLRIIVDQANILNKPSLIIVSAGPSVNTLRELRALHVASSDSLVTLLSDIEDVSRDHRFPHF